MNVDILSLTTPKPILITHAMQRGNMTLTEVRKILTQLIKKGFIVETKIGKRKAYQVTQTGISLLKQIRPIQTLLDEATPHSQPQPSGYLLPSPFSSRKGAGATETCPRQ